MKRVIIAAAIVVCAIAAIATHAVLPAKVDEALLDGVLVRQFGFPAVAIAYFLILYTHCCVVVAVSRRTAQIGAPGHGLVLGLTFAVMYVIGMQEIMLDLSPFSAWNADFVVYQAVIGLGDAIPVIILCVVAGVLLVDESAPLARGRSSASAEAAPEIPPGGLMAP